MTDGTLERALGLGGCLVATGLVVQLLSFFWNHPLAFIAFAAVGGGLVITGALVFLRATVRARSWRHEVAADRQRSARG